MKWFYNLKIGTKLIGGFITVALIAGVIGFFGITKISQINKGSELMYQRVTVPLSELSDISTSFQRVRISTGIFSLSTSFSRTVPLYRRQRPPFWPGRRQETQSCREHTAP